MSAFKKILAGTAGLVAAIGLASPAAAQYYPGSGYGGYNGYGNNVGSAVGQAINGVIAATQYGGYPYGNYGYNQTYGGINANSAVGQCARAVESGSGNRNRGYGYGYGNSYGGARVTGISHVEPRNRGAVRVYGFASNYTGYGYGEPSLGFSCKVDRYGRVTELRFDRNRGYRAGYNNSYNRGW